MQWRFSSEVGYATLPRFPQYEHLQNSQNSKLHQIQRNAQVPVVNNTNRQHASPHHEVATDIKQMTIRSIIITMIFNKNYLLNLGRIWFAW